MHLSEGSPATLAQEESGQCGINSKYKLDDLAFKSQICTNCCVALASHSTSLSLNDIEMIRSISER